MNEASLQALDALGLTGRDAAQWLAWVTLHMHSGKRSTMEPRLLLQTQTCCEINHRDDHLGRHFVRRF